MRDPVSVIINTRWLPLKVHPEPGQERKSSQTSTHSSWRQPTQPLAEIHSRGAHSPVFIYEYEKNQKYRKTQIQNVKLRSSNCVCLGQLAKGRNVRNYYIISSHSWTHRVRLFWPVKHAQRYCCRHPHILVASFNRHWDSLGLFEAALRETRESCGQDQSCEGRHGALENGVFFPSIHIHAARTGTHTKRSVHASRDDKWVHIVRIDTRQNAYW
jgi:hypothetical protein